MKESFYSISKTAVIELEIRRSKFIAAASPVDDETAANAFIQGIKDEHKRATHNVFAYLISEQLMRASDDGEPAGTAGKPVLDLIKRQGLIRTVVVVTRYFGGIKLGAGGLVRAYAEAAGKAIEKAGVVEKRLHREIVVVLDYQFYGQVRHELENSRAQILDVDYSEQVGIRCLLPVKVDIAPLLEGITSGQVEIREGEFRYV